MALSNFQKQNANLIWDKLVAFAGFNPPGFTLSDLLLAPESSSGALSLWVDQAVGADSNDGQASTPFKTITAALVAALTSTIKHPILIQVRAGTYNESLQICAVMGLNGLFTQELRIEGMDFVTPTLGSGSITSGTTGTGVALPRPVNTPTAAAKLSIPVAGAAWTAHELKGMFLNINGTLFPIADNTATTVELASEGSAVNGKAFTIVKHGVIIAGQAGPSVTAAVSGPGNSRAASGIHFKNLQIKSVSSYGMLIDGGMCYLEGCHVGTGAVTAGIQMQGAHAAAYFSRSFIQGPAAGSAPSALVMTFGPAYVGFSGSVFDGGGGTGSANRVIYANSCRIHEVDFFGHCVVQNGGFGVMFNGGPGFMEEFSNAHFVIRNMSLHGMNLAGQCCWVANPEIYSCSVGVQFRSKDQGLGSSFMEMNGTCFIDDCTSDAINVGGSHCAVSLGFSVGEIKGCGGYGISLGNLVTSSHNALAITSAGVNFTMGTNTSGDILAAFGGTPNTLNTFKVAGVTTDASSLNRVQVA